MSSTIYNIETTTKQIFMNGQALPLEDSQFSLLQFLITYPNRTFSAQQLLMSVLDEDDSEDLLISHISKIQDLLEPYGYSLQSEDGYSFSEA